LLPVTAAMAAVVLGVAIDGTCRLLMLFARFDSPAIRQSITTGAIFDI